jgi:hypothetical protein
MAHVNSESIGAVRDQAAQILQSVIEQATSRAMEQAKGSRRKASRFSRKASSKTPTVRDIAFNAASGAIELWQAARDRAGETMESVQSSVVDSAAEIKHSAQHATEEAVDRVRASGEDAVDRVKSISHAVGDLPHKAAGSGKSAATSTAKTGRNMFGLALWTSAAGAIIYYAFLNDERREQVRHIAMQAISEARTLLQDLQGQDGEFTS